MRGTGRQSGQRRARRHTRRDRLGHGRGPEDDAIRDRERCELELEFFLGAASGLTGLATWKTEPYRKLDEKALREDEPKTFERFLRQRYRRPFRLL